MVPRPRNGLSLCSGAGGLDMGLMLAEPGFHTRCYVEWEEYPRESLIAGQRAGYLAPAPIWDDVTTFDARPLAGAIDTLIAGYPCQPFSQAGQRKGEDDERHLWPDIERIAVELGDALTWCFFENVRGHVSLGLETVLRALRKMGFAVSAGIFSAEEVGATHERQRVFIVAFRPRGTAPHGDNLADSRCNQYGTQPGNRCQVGEVPGRERPEDGSDVSDRCGAELADAHGGHTSPEREQRGREQRFHTQGRGTGTTDVDDAGYTKRWAIDAGRNHDHRADAGRAQSDGRTGKSSQDLADPVEPGPQGREQQTLSGAPRHEIGRTTTELRSALLFPPGPSDMAAWSAALRMAPDLAPSTAFGDIAHRASQLAALVEAGELAEKAAEPQLCRMVDGLASRSRALRLLGNGVVPLEAAYAWRTLSAAHGIRPLDLGTADDHQRTGTDAGELV